MRVELRLIAVTVRRGEPTGPGETGEPELAGFGSPGAWPMRTLSDDDDPAKVAAEMTKDLLPVPDFIQLRTPAPPERVSFEARAGTVTVLYTVSVPSFWADPEVEERARTSHKGDPLQKWTPRWTRLFDAHGEPNKQLRIDLVPLLRHWRHRLAEEDAALVFLPRFFTMAQLHEVYQAVWGPAGGSPAGSRGPRGEAGSGSQGTAGAGESVPRAAVPGAASPGVTDSGGSDAAFERWSRQAFAISDDHGRGLLRELPADSTEVAMKKMADDGLNAVLPEGSLTRATLEATFGEASRRVAQALSTTAQGLEPILPGSSGLAAAALGLDPGRTGRRQRRHEGEPPWLTPTTQRPGRRRLAIPGLARPVWEA